MSPTDVFGLSAVAVTLGAGLAPLGELGVVLLGLLPTEPIREDASFATGAEDGADAVADIGLAVTDGETAGAGSAGLVTSTGLAGFGVSTIAAGTAGASGLAEEFAATGSARGMGGGGGGGVLAGVAAAATGATVSFVSAAVAD